MSYAGPDRRRYERRGFGFLRSLFDFVLFALLHRKTTELEWYLAWHALVVGVWVLIPYHRSIREDVIFAAAPEAILGALFAGHGLAALAVLWSERKARPRSQKNLDRCRHSALVSFGLWLALGVGYGLTEPRAGIAIPVLMSPAAAAMWVYLRLLLRYGPRTGARP